MPNRIIRDAILSSEKVAQLAWPEEVFYRRLMSIVDDYGRSEANPQLLRSRCYPLQTDAVRVTDISRWMAACQTAGLILCYAAQGKQYIEVINFGQQQRSPSKWPSPQATDIACNHLQSSAHLVEDVSEDVSESAQPRGFAEFWTAYPKKKSKGDAEKAFKAIKPSEQIVADMLQAIDLAKTSDQWLKSGGEFIPHPATWLRAKGWEDEHASTAKPWET